jgi:hypothetical protein
MRSRIPSRAAAATVVLLLSMARVRAFDDSRYPDLAGQWTRAPVPGAIGQPTYDPSKPWGRGQRAPLTAEYEAIFQANLDDQAAGGQGIVPWVHCIANGMPAIMTVFQPMEIVVTPEVTYIRIDQVQDSHRRVYTDGRDWPDYVAPAYDGYSIGRWIDADGSGRYSVLEIETRDLKGPRVYDASGIPLHPDKQSIIKERLYLSKADPNLLYDEITVIDHALTRPWTVTKSFRRSLNPRPAWPEYVCADGQSHVRIGKETYYLGAGGLLMPAKKDQPPPDLRYFETPRE